MPLPETRATSACSTATAVLGGGFTGHDERQGKNDRETENS